MYMDVDVNKLKEFILTLDTFRQQGFIDTPVTTDFDKEIRNFMVSTGIAKYTGSIEDMWISRHHVQVPCPLDSLINILTEIIDIPVDDLWSDVKKMNSVIVYTLPNCSKCIILKEWLIDEGIDFQEKLLDTEAQTNLIMENVFGDPPILKVDSLVLVSERLFIDDVLNVSAIIKTIHGIEV